MGKADHEVKADEYGQFGEDVAIVKIALSDPSIESMLVLIDSRLVLVVNETFVADDSQI